MKSEFRAALADGATSEKGADMADFCKQCSEELFGEDFKELAGLGDGAKLEPGNGWEALCEGCGLIIVNEAGECIKPYCPKHGEEVSA